LVAKKKLAIIVSIILLASLSTVGALYYGTNLIRPMYSPPNTLVLQMTSISMEPAIRQGNYILVDKNVMPSDLNTNYPNSDIIVFNSPSSINTGYIASRIVSVQNINGTLYFQTKCDNNGSDKWPIPVSPQEYDSRTLWSTGIGVSQDLVVGKVVDSNYK
jgi:signal peptidase I